MDTDSRSVFAAASRESGAATEVLLLGGELEPSVRDAFREFEVANGAVEWTGPVGSCEPPL